MRYEYFKKGQKVRMKSIEEMEELEYGLYPIHRAMAGKVFTVSRNTEDFLYLVGVDPSEGFYIGRFTLYKPCESEEFE